jgi:hypothetical protein
MAGLGAYGGASLGSAVSTVGSKAGEAAVTALPTGAGNVAGAEAIRASGAAGADAITKALAPEALKTATAAPVTGANLSAGMAALRAAPGATLKGIGSQLGGVGVAGLGTTATSLMTPELKPYDPEDPTFYMSGGYDPEKGFLPGYYSKTYKPFGMAMGGIVPRQNPAYPMGAMQQGARSFLNTNAPREVVGGYDALINPMTGQEQPQVNFAEGGTTKPTASNVQYQGSDAERLQQYIQNLNASLVPPPPAPKPAAPPPPAGYVPNPNVAGTLPRFGLGSLAGINLNSLRSMGVNIDPDVFYGSDFGSQFAPSGYSKPAYRMTADEKAAEDAAIAAKQAQAAQQTQQAQASTAPATPYDFSGMDLSGLQNINMSGIGGAPYAPPAYTPPETYYTPPEPTYTPTAPSYTPPEQPYMPPEPYSFSPGLAGDTGQTVSQPFDYTPAPSYTPPEPQQFVQEPIYQAPEPVYAPARFYEDTYRPPQMAYEPPPAPSYVPPEPVYTPPVYQEPEPVYTPPVYQEPEPIYRAPEPVYTPPVYQEPEPIYRAPEPVYTPPVYQEPEPIYRAPEPVYTPPVYQEPEPIYRAPEPIYRAPEPVYTPPVYQEPEPSYAFIPEFGRGPAMTYGEAMMAYEPSPAPVYQAPVYEAPAYSPFEYGLGGFEQNYDPFGSEYNFAFAKGGTARTRKKAKQPKPVAGKLVKGNGDGMSDSIHANIGGKQEARLADGEFVIPADVVSHLGNGSTDAGSKKLYAMMDRVRKSRTGRTQQAPQVNMDRMLPL